MACVCGDPPSISNGELRFAGPHLNGTKAEYDCDAGYTQAGGDSLLCVAGPSCTGPEPDWAVDATDANSGYPDCQAVEPDYDVYNTFNSQTVADDSSSAGLDSWAIFGILLALLLLLLLVVFLLLWYWCCRECCRRCCMRSCPCCRDCCYEIPYGHYPHQERPAGKRITAVTTHNNSQYTTKQAEPKDFVYVDEEKLHVPQGKPMDTKGQPVWMPHAHNVRKVHTSTK